MTRQLKNVVVVGAASAGLNAAKELSRSLPDTHRVVLIEANSTAFWSIGAFRAAVKPGHEDKIVRDLTTDSFFGTNSRHIALPSTRVIDLEADAVVVNRNVSSLIDGVQCDGQLSRIPFEKALLCLGSSHGFPARIQDWDDTKEKVLSSFCDMQRQIKNAQHILIVGGSVPSVEFLGEVLDAYPEKASSITLVTKRPKLISYHKDGLDNISKAITSQIAEKGVHIYFEDSVNTTRLHTGALPETQSIITNMGHIVKTDFVFIGDGSEPKTSLVAGKDASIIDENGQVLVDEYLRIKSDKPLWANYFVVGDANNIKVPKTSLLACVHGFNAALNVTAIVKAEVTGKGEPKLRPAPPPNFNFMTVPFGEKGGATTFGFLTFGQMITSKLMGKNLALNVFENYFSN